MAIAMALFIPRPIRPERAAHQVLLVDEDVERR
jgi:hypothetical protein